MTEAQFQKNIPRSSTTSRISIFSVADDDILEDLVNEGGIEGNLESPKQNGLNNTNQASYKTNSSPSKHLHQAQSEEKRELESANFSTRTISRLAHINSIYEYQKELSRPSALYKQTHLKLQKMIQDLRIFYQDNLCSWAQTNIKFAGTEELSPIIPNFLKNGSNTQPCFKDTPFSGISTCVKENSILINNNHYILKLSLDVDYFRPLEICETDQESYTCIHAPDSHFKDFVLTGTFNKKLQIFNLNQSLNTTNQFTFDSVPSYINQNKQIIYVGCRNGSLKLHDYRTKECVATYDTYGQIEASKKIQNLTEEQQIEQSNEILSPQPPNEDKSFEIQEFDGDSCSEGKSTDERDHPISFIDYRDNYILANCQSGFSILDVRTNKGVWSRKTENLQKSVFSGNSCQNVIGFKKNSNKIFCWTSSQDFCYEIQEHKENILDLCVHRESNEVNILKNKKIKPYQDSEQLIPQSIIEIYNNDKSRLRIQDKLTSFGELTNLAIDRDGTLLYGVSQDVLKAWKYYDGEQMQVLQESLSPLLEEDD